MLKPLPNTTEFMVSWKKGEWVNKQGRRRFGNVYLGMDDDTGAIYAVREITLRGNQQYSKEVCI